MKTAVKQLWLESEVDWGKRPDGYSLHVTSKDCQEYIEDYWNGMPDEVPAEYSRPDGEPILVEVSDELYKKIKKTKNGFREVKWLRNTQSY